MKRAFLLCLLLVACSQTASTSTHPSVTLQASRGESAITFSNQGAILDFGGDIEADVAGTLNYSGTLAADAGFTCNGSTHCGTITLAAATSGTATVVAGCHPVCTNTTSTTAVKCAVSTTTLTASEAGSSSDAINYFCF